jgi:hypothetical protein
MAFSLIPDDVPAEHATVWLAAKKVQIDSFDGETVCLPDGVIMDLETLQRAGRDLPDKARPTWAWATAEVQFELDIEDFIDADLVEEFDDKAEQAFSELQDMLDSWTAKWCDGMTMDIADQTVVVMIPPSWWHQGEKPS